MRVFGWVLIIGGLLWTLPGVLVTAGLFYGGFAIEDERTRNLSGGLGLMSLVVNGLIFVFPGLVVAGIGGLLARRQGSRREDDDDD